MTEYSDGRGRAEAYIDEDLQLVSHHSASVSELSNI